MWDSSRDIIIESSEYGHYVGELHCFEGYGKIQARQMLSEKQDIEHFILYELKPWQNLNLDQINAMDKKQRIDCVELPLLANMKVGFTDSKGLDTQDRAYLPRIRTQQKKHDY